MKTVDGESDLKEHAGSLDKQLSKAIHSFHDKSTSDLPGVVLLASYPKETHNPLVFGPRLMHGDLIIKNIGDACRCRRASVTDKWRTLLFPVVGFQRASTPHAVLRIGTPFDAAADRADTITNFQVYACKSFHIRNP